MGDVSVPVSESGNSYRERERTYNFYSDSLSSPPMAMSVVTAVHWTRSCIKLTWVPRPIRRLVLSGPGHEPQGPMNKSEDSAANWVRMTSTQLGEGVPGASLRSG